MYQSKKVCGSGTPIYPQNDQEERRQKAKQGLAKQSQQDEIGRLHIGVRLDSFD